MVWDVYCYNCFYFTPTTVTDVKPFSQDYYRVISRLHSVFDMEIIDQIGTGEKIYHKYRCNKCGFTDYDDEIRRNEDGKTWI